MAWEMLFKPLAAEGESAILTVDHVEKSTSFAITNGRSVIPVKISHVVTAVNVLKHVALAGRTERLDRILLALYHAHMVLSILHNVHRLARMDFIALHAMTAQVLDGLHWESLVANGDLV